MPLKDNNNNNNNKKKKKKKKIKCSADQLTRRISLSVL